MRVSLTDEEQDCQLFFEIEDGVMRIVIDGQSTFHIFETTIKRMESMLSFLKAGEEEGNE